MVAADLPRTPQLAVTDVSFISLRLILPEVWLDEAPDRIPGIHAAMEDCLRRVLRNRPDSMVLVERRLHGGQLRRGLVGCIDLEEYDYSRGAQSLIRATEATVPERIPPRMTIREGAWLELPHVMLLTDDRACTVVEPLADETDAMELAYDYDLMLDGGHLRGYFLTDSQKAHVAEALAALATPEAMEARYGRADLAPLLFAVGDGNHSLAAAKAFYEHIKARLGTAALLGFRGVEIAGLLGAFGSATAIASFAMTQEIGGDAELAGNIVVFTSAACMLTLFLWSLLLKNSGLL